MTWRVLVSAPYFIPVIEEYQQRLAAEGVELVPAQVSERLSETELIKIIKILTVSYAVTIALRNECSKQLRV